MQEIAELVPKLRQVKDLYQAEDFQILAQYLRSSKDQLMQELLSMKLIGDTASSCQVSALVAQINLLGTLIELPRILQSLDAQFEKVAKLKQDQSAVNFDPLNIEGA